MRKTYEATGRREEGEERRRRRAGLKLVGSLSDLWI